MAAAWRSRDHCVAAVITASAARSASAAATSPATDPPPQGRTFHVHTFCHPIILRWNRGAGARAGRLFVREQRQLKYLGHGSVGCRLLFRVERDGVGFVVAKQAGVPGVVGAGDFFIGHIFSPFHVLFFSLHIILCLCLAKTQFSPSWRATRHFIPGIAPGIFFAYFLAVLLVAGTTARCAEAARAENSKQSA